MNRVSKPVAISTEEYFFNIKEIDEQHKKFIEILNHLISLSNEKAEVTDDKLLSVLNELSDYLRYHFSTEEKLMTLANYQEIEKHIKEHVHYVDKIDEFMQGYRYRNPVLLSNMVAFTKKWFLSHILQTDARYIECLKAFMKENPGSLKSL